MIKKHPVSLRVLQPQNFNYNLSIMKLSVANIAIFVLLLRLTFLFRKHESNIKLLVKGK